MFCCCFLCVCVFFLGIGVPAVILAPYKKGFTMIVNENQRTSDPVKAHLTPGANAFIHVYSPMSGAV